jgi:hypothetical protein
VAYSAIGAFAGDDVDEPSESLPTIHAVPSAVNGAELRVEQLPSDASVHCTSDGTADPHPSHQPSSSFSAHHNDGRYAHEISADGETVKTGNGQNDHPTQAIGSSSNTSRCATHQLKRLCFFVLLVTILAVSLFVIWQQHTKNFQPGISDSAVNAPVKAEQHTSRDFSTRSNYRMVRIQNRATRLYLTINSNGDAVMRGMSNVEDQIFFEEGPFFRSIVSRKVLDARTMRPGDSVHAHEQHSGMNQRWTVRSNGFIQLFDNDDRVLDVDRRSTAVDAPVIVYTRNGNTGTPNQIFQLIEYVPPAHAHAPVPPSASASAAMP